MVDSNNDCNAAPHIGGWSLVSLGMAFCHPFPFLILDDITIQTKIGSKPPSQKLTIQIPTSSSSRPNFFLGWFHFCFTTHFHWSKKNFFSPAVKRWWVSTTSASFFSRQGTSCHLPAWWLSFEPDLLQKVYPLVMTNSSPWKIPELNGGW